VDKNKIYEFAIKIAFESGKVLDKHFGKIDRTDTKSTDIDLVTVADIESEKHLLDSIKNEYPDHEIVSEESEPLIKQSKYRWVIDPLDGTTNFVHNLPIFAVSIAFQINHITEIAVIYNPAAKKLFSSVRGSGSYLNGKKIKCSSSNTLSKSLIVTGFPYEHDELYDCSFEIFKKFYDKSRGVRRLGSAALDLCFVAMGRFDLFYEFRLKEWDVAAGALIAKEAGAIVSDWDGNSYPKNGDRITAISPGINKEVLKILKPYHKQFSI